MEKKKKKNEGGADSHNAFDSNASTWDFPLNESTPAFPSFALESKSFRSRQDHPHKKSSPASGLSHHQKLQQLQKQEKLQQLQEKQKQQGHHVSPLQTPSSSPSSNIHDFNHDLYTQLDTKTRASHQRFLSYFGMLSNSYYAKPLLFVSFILVAMNISIFAIRFFVILQLDASLAADGKSALMFSHASECQIFIDALMGVAYMGVINWMLALPAISFRYFRLHRENGSENHSVFHRCCLSFLIFESVALMGYIIYVVSKVASVDEVRKCLQVPMAAGTTSAAELELEEGLVEWGHWYLTLFVLLMTLYLLLWYQMAIFDNFRTHYYGQMGMDSTAHTSFRIQSDPAQAKVLAWFSRRHGHRLEMHRRLYMAVVDHDVEALAQALAECRQVYGTGFAATFYGNVRLWAGTVAWSTKNPLHLCCALGHVELVEMLLDAGFRLNHFDKTVSFYWSDINLYRILLDSLPWISLINNVDRKTDVYGNVSPVTQTLLTPLHCAVANDHVAVVQALVERGAKLNVFALSTELNIRLPPIFMAQSSDVAEVLIKAGANQLAVPVTSFIRTCYEKAFVQNKLTLCRTFEYWGGDFALTPLHAAAAANDAKKVTSLLDWGALPDSLGENVTGSFRRTALHWAAIVNSTNAAKELIEHGAVVNVSDIHGRTPLHWACLHHHVEVIELLLKSGGDPNKRDENDRTSVAIVAEHEGATVNIIASLVRAGADINAVTGPSQDTPMHIALKRGLKDTAIALLRNGADILMTNAQGKRPLDCTLSTDIQFLVKKEAGTRDVMISYTHSHTEFANLIRKKLEENKITVWMDTTGPSGIGAGAVWREEIARGIMNAAVVLCILTEDYASSKWCMKELALAKQCGRPIVAISSEHAGSKLSEELQVYLYTRQIIPFERAITSIVNLNTRNIQYEYNHLMLDTQMNMLLDGLRDEIEKNRLVAEVRRSMTSGQGQGHMNPLAIFDHLDVDDPNPLIFITHGDKHFEFANRIRNALRSVGFECYIDQENEDFANRIRKAKDWILRCAAFIPILSDQSIQSDIISDQMAFAEDKNKPIVPIMYTEPEFTLAQKYQLSRDRFFHFTGDIGFQSSFALFEEFLASTVLKDECDVIPLLEEAPPQQISGTSSKMLRLSKGFSGELVHSASSSSSSFIETTRLRAVSGATALDMSRISSTDEDSCTSPSSSQVLRKRRPSGFSLLQKKAAVKAGRKKSQQHVSKRKTAVPQRGQDMSGKPPSSSSSPKRGVSPNSPADRAVILV